MTRVFFLTCHGTLLIHTEGGGLGHGDPRQIPDIRALVSITSDIAALRRDYAGFLQGHRPPPVTAEMDRLGSVRLHVAAGQGTVQLERDGLTLSAASEGGVVTWTDAPAQEWESLMPIAEAELAHLVTILSNDWILHGSRRLIRSWETRLAPGHALKFGDVAIPLAGNLPFDAASFPFCFTVLVEGWRIERVCLFKPLIFYAAFNSAGVHAQLFHSLRSLVEFGKYDGHVHVMTDLDHETVSRRAPTIAPDHISVQPLALADFAGFVGAKYCILEHDAAWSHQPICYLDPDIVINANIRAMLIEMAVSEFITAPMEDVGPQRSWPSVGATLLQRDGRNPRFANGFNAGTLGIANLPAHAPALRVIRRIIENLLTAEGRDSLEWVDQEVANYVSFTLAHVDTCVLNRFVRYGDAHAANIPGPLTGLVHFWATGKHGREDVMARYIDVLLDTARHAHKLSS